MALRPDRDILATEIGYFMNEAAAVGKIVSISTAASGAQMDGTNSVATVKAASSGAVPIGVLLTEVVSLDLTRTPINWHKSQTVVGDKVCILRKGWVVTDAVTGTPTVGDAVLASSGTVMSKTYPWNAAANPSVGRFLNTKDENGFIKLFVDL